MAMSNLEKLISVLDPKFKPEDQLMLEEKETDTHSAMTVTIKNLTDYKHVLYRFDPNESEKFFPYFSRLKHLQKICDYFVFVQKNTNDTIYVFAIELKRGTDATSKQLQASKVFVDYLVKSAQRIYPELTNRIKIESISIKSNKKRPTGNSPLWFNDEGHLICNRSVITWNPVIEEIKNKNES